MHSKHFFWPCLASVLFLFSSANASSKIKGSAMERTVMPIGSVLPLSGPSGSSGRAILDAVDLAVNEMNACSSSQYRYVVHHEDSGTSPQNAPNNLKALLGQQVEGIIGGGTSGVTLALFEAMKTQGFRPLLSPSSTSPKIHEIANRDFLFTMAPSDVVQAKFAAQNLFSNKSKVGMLFIKNSYGWAFEEEFRKQFHGTLVSRGLDKEIGNEGFEIQNIIQGFIKQQVDSYYIIGNNIFSLAILEGLAAEGVTANIFGVDANADLIQDAKQQGRVSALSAQLTNMRGTVPTACDNNRYSAFKEAFRAKYGVSPLPFAEHAYDATWTLGFALAKSGKGAGKELEETISKVSKAPGEKVLVGQNMCAGFDIIKSGLDINFEGASGLINMENNSAAASCMSIWKFNLDDATTSVEAKFVVN